MKIIISHDVDHITVMEHWKDPIIPKFLIRSTIEFALGYVSFSEIISRLKNLLINKWNNINELMAFDRENNIPSTFFIGMSNGRGLSYTNKNAVFWLKRIIENGFDVGVHGIAFNDYGKVKREYNLFKEISRLDKFGIRMHYLKYNDYTLSMLSKVGYIFDSSLYDLSDPFIIGDMWEFPLCIMDGYMFLRNSRWQNQTIEQVKKDTKMIIDKAIAKNLKYFTVLFHDRYFSESFIIWRDWYIWLVNYLKNNGFEFISFMDAVKELRNEKQL